MAITTFRFLTGEMARHEAELLRQMVLANFAANPQAVLDQIDEMLSDEDRIPSASLLTNTMLANLPGDIVSRTSKEAIDQRLQEALARQAEMDAVLATGDMNAIRAKMREFQAGAAG